MNLGTDIQAILARGYMILKMLFDLPSCFGICLFLIQLVCATWTLRAILFNNCPKKVTIEEEKIDNPQQKIESVTFVRTISYLENHRLLN